MVQARCFEAHTPPIGPQPWPSQMPLWQSAAALHFAPSAAPTAGGGTGPGDWKPGTAPEGARCLRSEQCASGVCEGEGCGPEGGTCAPAKRACTKDLRPYCGCDGKTFRTSGTCPGRRFDHRGECTTGGVPPVPR